MKIFLSALYRYRDHKKYSLWGIHILIHLETEMIEIDNKINSIF